MTLVSERAEIEKGYSKQLKTWAAKWNNLIEKGVKIVKLSSKSIICISPNVTTRS